MLLMAELGQTSHHEQTGYGSNVIDVNDDTTSSAAQKRSQTAPLSPQRSPTVLKTVMENKKRRWPRSARHRRKEEQVRICSVKSGGKFGWGRWQKGAATW
ncbi:hypothetical protein DVH05_002641 [Phytophthora capsici]|nr:hypothetical protein DVH05_002641 [Phytophthora capsici]